MNGRHWTHEEVTVFFKEHGCTLLSPTYGGCNETLHFRCSCGKEATTIFRRFKFNKGGRCKKCSIQKMLDTDKLANGGKLRFQTEAFKKHRKQGNLKKYGVAIPLQHPDVKKIRELSNLKKYGVRHVSQVPEIKAHQREGFRQKYGVTHFMKNPESMAKYRQTLMDRYGVPSMAFLSRRSSKAAQEFFLLVFSKLPKPLQEKCYFSPNSREFNVWRNGEYFKYDFVQSALKKAIEYNGSPFHPQPEQLDTEVGWCLFRPNRTVKEARDYEFRKTEALRERGFDTMTVWDYEFKHSPDLTVQRCLNFIMQGNRQTLKPEPPKTSSP